MSKSKSVFDAVRGNAYKFLPEELVILGYNDPETLENKSVDPDWDVLRNHSQRHLIDQRIFNPVDQNTVQSIIANGVIQSITVVKGEDGRPWVTDGRRRVLHALEANKQLANQGLAVQVRVPALVTNNKNESDGIVKSLILNTLRRDFTIIEKGRHALSLNENYGMTFAEIGNLFDGGVSDQTIRLWIKLAKLAPEVQKAVENDVIKTSTALKLHKLSNEEQVAELNRQIEAKNSGAKVTAATVQNAVAPEKRERVVNRARKVLNTLTADEILALFEEFTSPANAKSATA